MRLKIKQKKHGIKEEIELAIQEIYVERLYQESITQEKLVRYLGEKLEGIVIVGEIEGKIKGEYKGYEFEIDRSNRVKILGKANIYITYELSPQGYTNEAIIINIQVQFKEGELRTLTCETEGVEIIETNTKFKVKENGLYQFKVIDTTNNEKTIIIPIEKIDREAPDVTIKLLTQTAYINEKIKAEITFTDQKSEVDIEKCKWVLNNNNKNIGVEEGSYTGGVFSSKNQEIETRSVTSADVGNMYLHILSVDKIGNTKEFISNAITVKTGYAISTPQDLQNMKKNLSASYYVVNDIDMKNFSFDTIEGIFTGTLNGQGHTISNFSIVNSSTGVYGNAAMFENLAGRAKICNLLMKDVNISSKGYHVAVFGSQTYSSTATHDIVFDKVGITGNLSGGGSVASFVGEITNTDKFKISFKDCYARTNLSGATYDFSGFTLFQNYGYKGGVVVNNCYWSGTSSGTSRSGSLITPSIVGNNDNQLIDLNISISNSYYDKEKFPLKIPKEESAVGKGLTTEQMKKQESYVEWDFDNTWYIGEDKYPELKFNEE